MSSGNSNTAKKDTDCRYRFFSCIVDKNNFQQKYRTSEVQIYSTSDFSLQRRLSKTPAVIDALVVTEEALRTAVSIDRRDICTSTRTLQSRFSHSITQKSTTHVPWSEITISVFPFPELSSEQRLVCRITFSFCEII